MPVILLERLPLPSLKTYTILSVGLLASALYYAHSFGLENEDSANIAVFELLDVYNVNMSSVTGSVIEKAFLMAYVLAREPWCLVVRCVHLFISFLIYYCYHYCYGYTLFLSKFVLLKV